MMRRAGSHAAHLLMEAVLGAVGLLTLAGCALAWRLAQGPIDITPLAARAERAIDAGGWRVAVEHASLAWEGFGGGDNPLDIRWQGATVRGPDGAALVVLPRGRVTLGVARMLRGRIAPRSLDIEGARVVVDRRADGSLAVQLGDAGAAPMPPPAGANAGNGAALLRGLAEGNRAGLLGQLRRARIAGASVEVRDAALGVVWRAEGATIALSRAGGLVRAEAALALAVPGAEATLTAAAEIGPGGISLVAGTAPVVPHAIALATPSLAALSPIDAPLSVAIAADLTPDLVPRQAALSLHLDAGRVFAPRGQAPVAEADALLRLTGTDRAELEGARFAWRRVPGTVGPVPVLHATARATRAAGVVQASFAATLDHLDFADLPVWWPHGVGGGARPWIAENITAGLVENGHVAGTLRGRADGSGLEVTALTGGLEARGMTLHWLRPVPPIEEAEAALTLEGPDALSIAIPRGRQGGMRLSGGKLRITGLSAPDQFAEIAATIDSELGETLTLLNHPRLRLLSRRKVDLGAPAGHAHTSLTLHLPLEDAVSVDDLAIAAKGRLTDVHLGGVVAGRDLDHGALDLAVDPTALTLRGQADLGGLPAELGVEMDFRAGPTTQVLEHYTARATASPAQAAALGVPDGMLTGGTAALTADYLTRRNGTGAIALTADLGPASLTLPIGWRKEAGRKAAVSARLALAGGRLTSIDHVTADGPGLLLRAHADMEGGQPSVLRIEQARLGPSDATGAVTLPGPGRRLRVTLRGRVLDLSDWLEARARASEADARTDGTAAPPEDERPGPPWSADLGFGRLVLARDEVLPDATASVETDGLHWTRARIEAGHKGEVRATIEPAPGRRVLSIASANAGAVLLAAGVADNIRGGRLRLDGAFDDRAPHAPLAGTATLEEFRITDAPAIGRLLKAMTLYGAVDLLRGPGLGWQKAVVPFRWRQRVLTLSSARAFSASLGLTAKGDLDLRRHRADIEGTVVPAYFFNQLLGRIPVLGQVFSPEKGGGVFAARYSVKGPLNDPKIGINPLSALTPGVLRTIFDAF